MNKYTRWYLYACHIVVPILFIGAAVLHFRDRLFLRWEFVVLMTAAALPFLLPLLAFYIKGVGKDGVFFNNIFAAPIFAPPTGESRQFSENPQTADTVFSPKSLSDYSRAARKVLRTLWKYQRQQFKDDFSKRWGFGLHPLAIDFDRFSDGAAELRSDELIQDDARGMVFLSDKGVVFCRKNDPGLQGGGDTLDKFGPS